jgi:large repetitive protein
VGRRRLWVVVAGILAPWAAGPVPAASAQATPVITSPQPPAGAVGATYLYQFTATGFTSAPTYSVTSGPVPPGVIIDAQGNMFGVPTAAGTFGPTTVCATNGAQQACQTFTIEIRKLTPILFSQPSPGGPVGTAVTNTTTVGSQQVPTGTITFRL